MQQLELQRIAGTELHIEHIERIVHNTVRRHLGLKLKW